MSAPHTTRTDYHEWRRRRAEAFGEACAAGAPGPPPPATQTPDTLSAPTPPEALYPAEPIPLPGTPQRKALLHERALAGAELHQPGDVVAAPDQRADYRRLRNGHDKIDPQTGVAQVRPEPNEKPSALADRNRGRRVSLALLRRPQLASLGTRLRELRGSRSLGQIALAAGITRQALCDLEHGRRLQPTLAVLWALADVFRLTLDELVGRSGR